MITRTPEEMIERALVASYEIRSVVDTGQQPPLHKILDLTDKVAEALERLFEEARYTTGHPSRAYVLDASVEFLVLALSILAKRGWRSRQFNRRDTKNISIAIEEAAREYSR